MSLTVADSRRERPATMPTAERGGAGTPCRVAFWLLALVFAATMLGTALPTPLADVGRTPAPDGAMVSR